MLIAYVIYNYCVSWETYGALKRCQVAIMLATCINELKHENIHHLLMCWKGLNSHFIHHLSYESR